jgi:hypothetical protein
VFVPVSCTVERKEREASWENDPYINSYGNEDIFPELLHCIHDNYELLVCCCALLLTQLSRSSFSFSFDTVTCILRQHTLTSFRNYSIAAFNQQLEYILAA